MIDIEELEYEYSAFFGDKEGEHNLLKRMKPLLAEVKRLREQVKDLEYEVEHWKWELQTRMCPIEFDALVNEDEEE